jgi:hypothetical protein
MKTAKKTIVMALAAVMVLTGLSGPLMAKSGNSGYQTPSKSQKTPQAGPLDALCVLKLVQNTGNTEPGALEAEIVEKCCPDVDACCAEIERLKKDPPEIPAKAWLMAFQWFRDLDPALQTLIGTAVSAILVAGLTYMGTLAK